MLLSSSSSSCFCFCVGLCFLAECSFCLSCFRRLKPFDTLANRLFFQDSKERKSRKSLSNKDPWVLKVLQSNLQANQCEDFEATDSNCSDHSLLLLQSSARKSASQDLPVVAPAAEPAVESSISDSARKSSKPQQSRTTEMIQASAQDALHLMQTQRMLFQHD